MSDFYAESAKMSNRRKARVIPMYDELRENLMAQATHFSVHDETSLLLLKAADAIEELLASCDNFEAAIKDLVAECDSREWVPVTERLPENGSLIGNLICDSDGQIRIARQCAEIQLKEKTVYTDLVELADLLEEKCPASNWNDCTHITHWMPLPQPPEKEDIFHPNECEKEDGEA